MNRILVTGAGGFAGSHLVDLLKALGPVVGWDRADVDLVDRAAVRRAILALRPTHVSHCAGSPHVGESWRETTTPLASNVMATHHLLEALGETGIRPRVLVTGSATVYAPGPAPRVEDDPVQPGSPYAVTKLAQEQLALRAILEDGVDVIVTRSFNHTGPRQRPQFAPPAFARQIALIERGAIAPVLRVGNLETERDLSDVRDTVRAYAALMDSGVSGTVYNVASGVARPIRTIVEGLIARCRVPVRIETDPERFRPNDTPTLVGDASRLRLATGWRPQIPFEQTLDDLLEYWRASV